jgi:hypothetical protein
VRHYRLIVGLLILALATMLIMGAVTLVNGPVSAASGARNVPVIGPASGPGLSKPLPNAPAPSNPAVWL